MIAAAAFVLGWVYGFAVTRRRGWPLPDQIQRGFAHGFAMLLLALLAGALAPFVAKVIGAG